MLVVISILFFGLFLVVALSAILVRNPVLSVLCLVLAFVLGAGFTFSLGLEYLGILLLLIYVGAISVLFLFVVMLLNIRLAEINQSLLRFWWLGCLIGCFFLIQLIVVAVLLYQGGSVSLVYEVDLPGVYLVQNLSNMELIGEVLYLYMGDFFLLAGLLLLVAIMGPVYISKMDESPYFGGRINSGEQLVRTKVEEAFFKK